MWSITWLFLVTTITMNYYLNSLSKQDSGATQKYFRLLLFIYSMLATIGLASWWTNWSVYFTYFILAVIGLATWWTDIFRNFYDNWSPFNKKLKSHDQRVIWFSWLILNYSPLWYITYTNINTNWPRHWLHQKIIVFFNITILVA